MLLLQTGDGQLPADESVSARALEGKKIADRKRFSRLLKFVPTSHLCPTINSMGKNTDKLGKETRSQILSHWFYPEYEVSL